MFHFFSFFSRIICFNCFLFPDLCLILQIFPFHSHPFHRCVFESPFAASSLPADNPPPSSCFIHTPFLLASTFLVSLRSFPVSFGVFLFHFELFLFHCVVFLFHLGVFLFHFGVFLFRSEFSCFTSDYSCFTS